MATAMDESSSVEEAGMAAMAIGAIGPWYAQAMVVAVAIIMGATAAMSAVSGDDGHRLLGVKASAAWLGALVQHSAPLQSTTKPDPCMLLPCQRLCEPTSAPLLCKWHCVDCYQVLPQLGPWWKGCTICIARVGTVPPVSAGPPRLVVLR